MKKIILFAILVFSCSSLLQAKAKDVLIVSDYEYVTTIEESIQSATQEAKKRAIEQGIENEFGRVIVQRNSTVTDTDWDKNKFTSFGESQLKGEFVREEYFDKDVRLSEDGKVMTVSVKIRFVARECSVKEKSFEYRVLRNGVEDKFTSTDFRNGDDLYVKFQSPKNGFLCIYLVDASGDAYCLLPYQNSIDGIYKIIGGEEYIFFSNKYKKDQDVVDEYVLTAFQKVENNVIYILFSQNDFVKANDAVGGQNFNGDRLPRYVPMDKFNKWMTAISKDKDMEVDATAITITK